MTALNVPISDLKTKLLRPALTSHYICNIQLPDNPADFFDKLGVSQSDIKQNLQLSCCDASLPGSSVATHELNDDYTGVTQKNAYRRLYDDRADFTFYIDTTYLQLRFFERWIQYITGEQQANNKPNDYFRVRYPKYYKASKIELIKFERDSGAKILLRKNYTTSESLIPYKIKYTFINAFPSSINSIPVSYDNAQLLKCTVSFTYDRYILSGLTESDKARYFQPAVINDLQQNPYLDSSTDIRQYTNNDLGISYSSTLPEDEVQRGFETNTPVQRGFETITPLVF